MRATGKSRRVQKLETLTLTMMDLEDRGMTIGQVYAELSRSGEFYDLQEVINCFIGLRNENRIYRINTAEPTETARWKATKQ